MATKILRAVILGAPASGKGTIASRIVNKFNLEHVSSGDKLRLNIKNKTAVGLQVDKYLQSGQLVPDKLMITFITKELEKVGDRSWLLDGFPRTLEQAKSLWTVQKVDIVLNLIVPFDIIIERVKGRLVHLPSGRVYNTDFNAPKNHGKDDITGEDLVQRPDDRPDVVMKRLQHYENITRPVIDYYGSLGILRDFSGSTSDEIWPQVLSCLNEYTLPHEISHKL